MAKDSKRYSKVMLPTACNRAQNSQLSLSYGCNTLTAWFGRNSWQFMPLFTLILGSMARFYQLTYHSLDLDESFSLFWAKQPISILVNTLLRPSNEVSPPFYFLVLKGWVALLGESEIVLRTFSALLSVLYLGLLFRFGQQIFTRRVALIAVIIAALNPFLIWLGQEVRMYALGAVLSLASMMTWIQGLTNGNVLDWANYALCTLLAAYTHLGAALVIPAQVLMLIWIRPSNRRSFICMTMALLIIGLGYLPYAYNAWMYSGRQIAALTRYRLAPLTLTRTLVERFMLNNAAFAATNCRIVLPIVCFLLVLGYMESNLPIRAKMDWRKQLRSDGISLRSPITLYLFVPLALIYILSLRHPLFQTKILIFVFAPFVLWLATGIVWILRRAPWLGWFALTIVLLIELIGLRYNWYPGYEKENWREAARYVENHSTVDDAVLVHLEYYHVPFEYYYRGAAPVLHPFGSHIEGFHQIDETLQIYSQQYNTLWLVLSGEFLADPEHYVERWVAERYPLITAVYPKAIAVKGYVLRYRLAGPPSDMRPVSAVFDGCLRLLGYQIDQVQLRATDMWLHPPSNWIHVTLYWQALEAIRKDFNIWARMTDNLGQIWGAELNRDTDVLHMYPPASWQTDEIVRTDHDINLNPITPPGQYQIEISVVQPNSELRWPVECSGTVDNHITLTRVQVK